MKLEEVKMEISCLIDLIVPLRPCASYTKHDLTSGIDGDIVPCTDIEVAEYIMALTKMKLGDDPATLVISDIEWENYGNCAGDELFPVIMEAQLLPGKIRRFYVTIDMAHEEYGGWDRKEYIWYPIGEENEDNT